MKKPLIRALLLLLSIHTLAYADQFKGRLEWVHKVELRVLDSGIIKTMNVTVGQVVKKGTVIVQMDQREFTAKLAEAEARLKRASIKVASAERDAKRTQEMYDRALIADEELKDAELKKAAAMAGKASAQSAQAIAKIALERTALKAPFHAIILEHNVWQGDVVYKTLQQKAPVVVAPANQMLARVLVNANILRKYHKGQAATVIVRGKQYKGRIHSLGVESVRIEPNGAVYELDIIFNRNPQDALRQAEVVQVRLP